MTKRIALLVAVLVLLGVVGPPGLLGGNKPHRVILRWHAPRPRNGVTVASYNIYRRTKFGRYEKIASGITDRTYTDLSVEPRSTYIYAVTSIDPRGQESSRSVEAKAVIRWALLSPLHDSFLIDWLWSPWSCTTLEAKVAVT